jgi:hypothetical protein
VSALFDHLETALNEKPLFLCEEPDGRKDLSEHARQSWFVQFMRKCNPHIEVHANMNHGARFQPKAIREGMVPGVFDMTIAWDCEGVVGSTVCWAEFKGYEKSGRVGTLSQNQIDWGNSMHRKGFAVACFFSGKSLIAWLRECGAPVRGSVAA